MSKLTRKEIKNYIKNDTSNCPYCGDDRIRAYAHDWDLTGAYTDILCQVCGERWTLIYEPRNVTYEED